MVLTRKDMRAVRIARNTRHHNQCDGCRAGMVLRGDIHYRRVQGRLVQDMACQRYKYSTVVDD